MNLFIHSSTMFQMDDDIEEDDDDFDEDNDSEHQLTATEKRSIAKAMLDLVRVST